MGRFGKSMLIVFAILALMFYAGMENKQEKERFLLNRGQAAIAKASEEREFPIWFPLDDSHYRLDIVHLDLKEGVYHKTKRCVALEQLFGYNLRDIIDGKHTLEIYLYEAGVRGFIPCPECYDSYGLLRSVYDALN